VLSRSPQLPRTLEAPPLSLDDLLTGFTRVGLVKTVAELRRRMA